MKTAIALAFSLLVLVDAVGAVPTLPQPIPVDAPLMLDDGTPGLREDCVVGNPNDPNMYLTNWAEDEIWIQYLVWPHDTCLCGSGFQIDSFAVRLFGTSGFTGYPANFSITATLESGVWNEERQCWYPGTMDCVSQAFPVTVAGSGVVEFTIPLGDQCDCAYMDYVPNPEVPGQDSGPYLISFRMPTIQSAHDPYQGVFPLIDGEGGNPCTSFWREEDTWLDAYDYFQGYGDFYFRANASCCENPVATDPVAWDEIKAIYR